MGSHTPAAAFARTCSGFVLGVDLARVWDAKLDPALLARTVPEIWQVHHLTKC